MSLKALLTLVEKPASYAKALGKKGVLMTESVSGKVNVPELKYSSLTSDVFELSGKSNIRSAEIGERIDKIDFVQRFQNDSDFVQEIKKNIYDCVTQNAQGNMELINSRISKLDKRFYSNYLMSGVNSNSSFLLDNIEKVNVISENLAYCDDICMDINSFIKALSEDNIQEALLISKKVPLGDKKAIDYFYKLRSQDKNFKIANFVNEVDVPYNPKEFKLQDSKLQQIAPEEQRRINKLSHLFGKNTEECLKSEQLLKDLRNIIGSEEFSKIDWNQILKSEKCLSVASLENMVESSKFFTRLESLKGRNGINFTWATAVNDISKNAAKKIQQSENFDDVLKYIAEKYRNCSGGSEKIGKYRGNNFDHYECVTGYGDRGFNYYTEYIPRFTNRKRISPYKDMALTHIQPSDCLMVHPYCAEVNNNMKYANACYDKLKLLISKAQTTKMSQAESKQFDNLSAELYYILANTMPFSRGSNGISDVLIRSLYKSVGKDLPALNKNVSLDLEAFCMPLDAYKSNWNNFFSKTFK